MERSKLTPWLYVGPALIFLGFFLIFPTLATLQLSFLDARSDSFVGMANYEFAFTSSTMLLAFRNNAIWLIIFILFTVGLGLAIAVLLDNVKYENIAKSSIFLPQAISFVGAGVIWRFVYDYRPSVGMLNAFLNAIIPNFDPVGWLVNSNIALYSLVVTGIWMWTGYAMVIFSAAIKNIPEEITEAARVDGANGWQIFRNITIPMISSTIVVVTTTLVITALKVFDLVYVMTGGRYDTNVIALQMYRELYINRHNGRAAAVAVVLMLAIIPIMLFNIKRFQEEERQR
jgi:alpha-glucoside transport system permease protein